jgi:hypothetical protein
MKYTLPMIALSVAALGFSTGAQAQAAKKLFFEGDIVRHALPNQAGPFCVLNNQYKRKEAVAFRVRIMKPDGEVADSKALKAVTVELGNGQKVPMHFGGHGMPPTDFFWSIFWTVPDNHPTGTVGYKIVATMMDDSTVEWKPFNRATTELMVVDGEPDMKK